MKSKCVFLRTGCSSAHATCRKIRDLDSRMRAQNRKILLLLDNFSGHRISYSPSNIDIEFLAPNMTSHIQPLDQGIIRTFKAIYRRSFCMRALEADDGQEEDIWKITIKEAMEMATKAWDLVSSQTIHNCWRHAQIMPTDAPVAEKPSAVAAAWDPIYRLLEDSSIGLPATETAIESYLGPEVASTSVWRSALAAANDFEHDDVVACGTAQRKIAGLRAAMERPVDPNLLAIEEEVSEQIKELRKRNRVWRAVSVDDFIDSPDESTLALYKTRMPTDVDIVAAVKEGRIDAEVEVIEIEDTTDEETEPAEGITNSEVFALCDRLISACRVKGIGNSLAAARELFKIKGELHERERASLKQTDLSGFFKPRTAVQQSQDDVYLA